jgi:hypothetical protein
MDYGEIFIGTFRTIWRHKRLWLFGILGQIIGAVIGGIIGAAFSLRFLNSWFSMMSSFMGTNESSAQFMQGLLSQFFAWWGVFACLIFLVGLANYVVDLIMRGAIIGEAGIAWGGGATDTRRGLRTGANRAISIFVLDLLWRVPLAIIIGGVSAATLIAFIGGVAGLSRQSGNGGGGAAFLLGICGAACCLVVLGLLIAAFIGIFQPLMYQSAVQGRRSIGEAIAEGWHLAASHLGPLFIFWILVLLVGLVAGLLVQIVAQPLSLAWSGSLTAWIAQVMQSAESGRPPALPPMPAINSGLFLLMIMLTALVGLVVNSFAATFNLTMYAAVYRRLTGGTLAYKAPPAPLLPAESAPQATPAELAGTPVEPAEPAAPAGSAQIDAGTDLGLSVPDEPVPPADENRPLA